MQRNFSNWQPKTSLGRDVKEGRITSIAQIFHNAKKIEEPEIIDILLPDLKNEVIKISSVQRMTKNNRKQRFRVVAIVGDGNGYVGLGAGKDIETKAAIDNAIKDAKKNIIPVMLGCGSWQCGCGTAHSIPFTSEGHAGAATVVLKPAPRGVGLVASDSVRKLLQFAGIKDIWTFSRGSTRSEYNTLLAAYRALLKINKMKNTEHVFESVRQDM
ncbi:MAG: 30S ribosomal protein S5 [Candidatus Micrarchaeia archaeon]